MAARKSPGKSPTAAASATAVRKASNGNAPARKTKRATSSRTASSTRDRTSAAKKPSATKVNPKAPTRTAAHKAKPGSRKASPRNTKETNHIDRVWELAERIGICMFISWDGKRQRARPLAAHVDRTERAIYFLTDIDGQKDEQIAKFPIVSLAFADPGRMKYVAITGKATLSNDRGKIRDLWNSWAKAWWDSAEDPGIRVLRVSPEDAELWDSPGRIAATVAMLSAVVTGKAPKLLDNAKLETL